MATTTSMIVDDVLPSGTSGLHVRIDVSSSAGLSPGWLSEGRSGPKGEFRIINLPTPAGATYKLFSGPTIDGPWTLENGAYIALNPLYELSSATSPTAPLFYNATNPKYAGGMKFDGVTDDFPAYKSVVASATATGGRVLFPSGTSFCNYLGNAVPQITNKPVIFTGAGKEATLFTAPATAAPGNAYLFYCDVNKRMAVEDLTATGPSNPNTFATIAVRHDGTSGDVRVTNCRLLSFLYDVLIQTGADGLVEHCELTQIDSIGGAGCVGSANAGAPGGFVRIFDCDIHDFGYTPNNQQHGVYIYQDVSLLMRDVRFRTQRGTGWCIQHQGLTGISKDILFDHIFCDSDTYNGIVTTGSNLPVAKSRVTNSNILSTNQSLTVEFDIDVINCTLSGALKPIVQLNNASKIYVNAGVLDPQAGQPAITASAANSEITVFGVRCTCTKALLTSISGGAVGTCPVYDQNNQFSDAPWGAPGDPTVYGDGSDGAFVADGAATPAWATLVSNVYTMTRSVYLTKLTVNAGITIKTGNFFVCCWWYVGNATGILDTSGSAAAGATGGGGAGGNIYHPGSSGTTGTTGAGTQPAGIGTLCPIGSNGGAGGTSATPNAGGLGGVVTGSNLGGDPHTPYAYLLGLGMNSSSAAYARFLGGSGGGSGGGDGVNAGGGGGGPGGCCVLFAYFLDNAGTIRANGGNGGNGVAGTAGGGGGGGGGGVRVFYRILKQLGTLQANGGIHGNAAGAGTNGTDGSVGSTRNQVA